MPDTITPPSKYERKLLKAAQNNDYYKAEKIISGRTHWLKGYLKTKPVRPDKEIDGTTALQVAVENGNSELVRLFSQQAEHDGYIIQPSTLLHLAAQKNNIDMVTTLIACGADINARNHDNQTPLEVAANRKPHYHPEMTRFLLDKGAEISPELGMSVFCNALQEGDIDTAHSVLRRNIVDINAKMPLMENGQLIEELPLIWGRNKYPIVGLLLENGANIAMQGKNGETPISIAAAASEEMGGMEVVRALAETYKKHHSDADMKQILSSPNADGTTALTHTKNIKTFEYLWKQGLRPTKEDCLTQAYSELIKHYTKSYYNSGNSKGRQESNWKQVIDLQISAKGHNIEAIDKYVSIGKKEDGIHSGGLVISLSSDPNKPEGERIKYWMQKSTEIKDKPSAANHLTFALKDVYYHQLAADIFGKENAPKAKFVRQYTAKPEHIHYVSRFLAPPAQTTDMFSMILFEQPPPSSGASPLPGALESAAYMLTIGNNDIKPVHFIKATREDTTVRMYGIDYEMGGSVSSFGGSQYQKDNIALKDEASSQALASTLSGDKLNQPEYIDKIQAILGNPDQNQILNAVSDIAVKISAHNVSSGSDLLPHDFATPRKIIAKMTDQYQKAGYGQLLPTDTTPLINETKKDTDRAKSWVDMIRKKPQPDPTPSRS